MDFVNAFLLISIFEILGPSYVLTLTQLFGVPTVYSAVDSYEYLSDTALECPIYSFGGTHDGEQDIGAWAMETSSDRSESVLYPGGGFYLLDPDNEVSTEIGWDHYHS